MKTDESSVPSCFASFLVDLLQLACLRRESKENCVARYHVKQGAFLEANCKFERPAASFSTNGEPSGTVCLLCFLLTGCQQGSSCSL